ncbi:MAG: hypothetical protein ACOCRK_09875 [bacterium]
MRTDKFEKEIKDAILFERESIEKYYIKTAHLLRKYDIPDQDIITILWSLYTKARNDVKRYEE